jgi:hypothetical protein
VRKQFAFQAHDKSGQCFVGSLTKRIDYKCK